MKPRMLNRKLQTTTQDGFYFDRHGYERPCLITHADGTPLYALDLATERVVPIAEAFPVTTAHV